MQPITFATTNRYKYFEVQSILSTHNISVDFARASSIEIQSDSLEEIAAEKAKSAFDLIKRPLIVEDDGLYVDTLKGFPGQYSSYVFKTIGNDGILKLLGDSADRSASFRSLIAFYDGSLLSISEGNARGSISKHITEGGWGYDPIFIPRGTTLTFSELKEKKAQFSHRKNALDNFARWYADRDHKRE